MFANQYNIMSMLPRSLDVQALNRNLKLVSAPEQIKEIQKHERLGEKAAVRRKDPESNPREIALKDPAINQISLQGKEWMFPKERQYLNDEMQHKGHNEARVDELINKLTLSFEKVLDPRGVKLLEQGSFKSLNDLIENNNIGLNREMLTVNGVDAETWKDFKAVVKEFAQYEKVNNLERYSDMPEVDVFDIDVNAKLVPAMLETLNEGNSQAQYAFEDVQKFFNTLNQILAANFDDSMLKSFNTEEGLNDLFKSLSNESRQADIRRILLNKGEDTNIFNALLTTMEELVKKQTKAEEGAEMSPIFKKIESDKVRKVLEILVPNITEINSASALKAALEGVESFDLNRTLLINNLKEADFNAAIGELVVPEKVY